MPVVWQRRENDTSSKETTDVHALATIPSPDSKRESKRESGHEQSPFDTESRLAALFEEHARLLLRAALRVTGNESDAEDAVQTVFLRLVRREEIIDMDHPSVGGYLHRACVNAALDQLRQRRRAALDEVGDISQSPDLEAGPSRRLEAREIATALRRALVELSPRAAEIFTLRYFDELSNQQIAAELDTSPGVVAVTLHRSRHQLKGILAPLLGETS